MLAAKAPVTESHFREPTSVLYRGTLSSALQRHRRYGVRVAVELLPAEQAELLNQGELVGNLLQGGNRKVGLPPLCAVASLRSPLSQLCEVDLHQQLRQLPRRP